MVGPLAEVGVYNLKSLTALLGPAVEVLAAEHTAIKPRFAGDREITDPGHDVSHVILRHESGALSSVVSSHSIQRYRRPALEIYGSKEPPICSATIGTREALKSGAQSGLLGRV